MLFKYKLFSSFLISLIMSTIMSFIIVSTALGFQENFLNMWLNTGFRGFCIAFPAVFLVMPLANKMADFIMLIFKEKTALKRRVVFAFSLPFFMCFIMANFGTLYTIGFTHEYFSYFTKIYVNELIVSFPLAFFIPPFVFKVVRKILG